MGVIPIFRNFAVAITYYGVTLRIKKASYRGQKAYESPRLCDMAHLCVSM